MNTEPAVAFGIVGVKEGSGGGCEDLEACRASMKSPKSSSSSHFGIEVTFRGGPCPEK